MSLLRSSTAIFSVASAAVRAPAARCMATSAVRSADIPKGDTHSGQAVKADKHDKSPEQLQKEHTRDSDSGSSSSSGTSTSPSDKPTHSEDAVHAEKHSKDPKQLQKETVNKLHD